jgi:hypothetical protein
MRGSEVLIKKALSMFEKAMETTEKANDSKDLKQFRKNFRQGWAREFSAGKNESSEKGPLIKWAGYGRTIDTAYGCKISSKFSEFEHYNITICFSGSRNTKVYKEILKPLIEFFPEIDFFVVVESYENGGYGYNLSYYMFEEGSVLDDDNPDDEYLDSDNGEVWFVTPEEYDPKIHGAYYVDTLNVTVGAPTDEKDDLDNDAMNQAQCDYLFDTVINPMLANWILNWGKIIDKDEDGYPVDTKDMEQNEAICVEAVLLNKDAKQYINIKKTPAINAAIRKKKSLKHCLFYENNR